MPSAVTVTFPGPTVEQFRSVATIAALRAYSSSGLTDGIDMLVEGYTAAGDGGGGHYVWAAASMAIEDGSSVIRPSDKTSLQAGRWLATGPRQTIWAESFGFAIGNTGAQNATAIAEAIADGFDARGGILLLGRGDFTVDEFVMPPEPKVINIQGAGMRATRMTMGTPSGPLIRKEAGGGANRITGANIGNFTVRAHASSDIANLAHVAINYSGFGNSTFHDIGYEHNGLGSVGCLFSGDSFNALTYRVDFVRIVVSQCFGPSRVVYANNAAFGVLANPNIIELRDSWVYACNNITVIADLGDTSRSAVRNCIFEDCPGTQGVILGQTCVVDSVWFELLAANVLTDAARSTDGSGSTVSNNYMSDATSFIDTIAQKPLWINNRGGGADTITGAGVTKVGGATANPAAPTIARAGGTTGDPALTAANVAIGMDALGRVTYHLQYTVTPAAAAYQEFTVTPPAGYVIETIVASAIRGSNGVPATNGLGTPSAGTTFFIGYAGADSHTLIARVTIRKS